MPVLFVTVFLVILVNCPDNNKNIIDQLDFSPLDEMVIEANI